ncbi:ribonuclease P protein component [Bacteroides sp. 224]|uniref:ribonuclease P protein component n=1 Tax=Bacteroides sp. 224 TaxID=2302936 RepID=UPI0013D5009A|nr:ribonuclease P protein component [Bacteroides sp. 224]NDV65715.1 ribonuclease P protein component [Bacteroides sp. 224]
MQRNTFCKAEKLNSKKLIEKMFEGGSKSFSVFPLRMVCMELEEAGKVPAAILISVPKKRFKRAVHRNRIKRQIREAYRKNKHELLQYLEQQEKSVVIAFIYLSNEMISSTQIEDKMKILLARTIEKLS